MTQSVGHATPKSYFEKMYGTDPDPWSFDSSWYESRKYALTVAALPERRYRRAVEPGCANGTLTRVLAARCDQVHAFDFVPRVVERARNRLADLSHVEVTAGQFPAFWPKGTGDLVVWSEVIYYLDHHDRDVAGRRLLEWLEPGGTVVACHYTGATDYPLPGRDVAPWIDSIAGMSRVSTLLDRRFELAVWTRGH